MDKARHTIGRELVAETEGVRIVRYHCNTCGSSKRPQARRTAKKERHVCARRRDGEPAVYLVSSYCRTYGEDFLRAKNKVCGHFQPHLLCDRNELPDPRSESAGISALNEYNTRPAESADKTFARREAGYPSGRGLFNIVRSCGGPSHQMAIVNDIFLTRFQLDLVNGSETIQEEHSLSAHF